MCESAEIAAAVMTITSALSLRNCQSFSNRCYPQPRGRDNSTKRREPVRAGASPEYVPKEWLLSVRSAGLRAGSELLREKEPARRPALRTETAATAQSVVDTIQFRHPQMR